MPGMTTADPRIVVTPPGLSVEAWGPRIDGSPRFTLDGLLAGLEITAPGSSLVVLGAHPDDESLGCGRLMSLWRRRVGDVIAVLATAGESCLEHIGRTPPGLARRRMLEWENATEDLGVTTLHRAELPDGEVEAHRGQLRVVLEKAVRAAPRPVVIAAPWRHDPHPDHQACGAVAEEVAADLGVAVLEFPVWMTFWCEPDSSAAQAARLVRIVTDEIAEQDHERACARYESQILPLADDLTAVVPAEMLEHHRQQLLLLMADDETDQS